MRNRWLFASLIVGFLLIGCHSHSYDHYESANTSLDSTYESHELEGLIAPYRSEVEATMNEKIGFAPEPLIKYAPESSLSNFVADAVFDFGIEAASKSTDFSGANNQNTMALLNFGGLRAPINAGEITVGNIFELMPFDNTIMLVELDRMGIDQLIAYLKKEGGQPISNAQFDYSAAEPVMKLDGANYQENNVYIITSNYLAGGGDGMTFLRDAEKKWDSGKLIRDVLITNVKKVDTLKAQQNTGRIILTP